MEAFVGENLFQMAQRTTAGSRLALLSLSLSLSFRTLLGSPDLPLPSSLTTDVFGDLSQRVAMFVLILRPLQFPWQPLEGVGFFT